MKPIRFDCQTVKDETSDGPVYYSQLSPNKNLHVMTGKFGARTALQAFERGLQLSGDGPCAGIHRGEGPYTFLSYSQVLTAGRAVVCELMSHGLLPGQNTRVGIFSPNSLEFMSLLYGCYSFSMVAVPMYDTLGEDAMLFIVKQCELEVVLCSSAEKAQFLLCHRDDLLALKILLATFPPDDTLAQQCARANLLLLSWSQALAQGQSHVRQLQPCAPEDVMVIMYTSGTTGVPKGAIIKHDAFMMCANSFKTYLQLGFADEEMGPSNTVHLSVMPLAHVYESMIQASVFLSGGRIGLWRGQSSLLFDDMQNLQPTFFPSVPRVFNRLYDKALASVLPDPAKAAAFRQGIKEKMELLKRGKLHHDTKWDRTIFKDFKQLLGGKVKVLTGGSAPMSGDVAAFLKTALGACFFETYGQTEASGQISSSYPGDYSVGNVGGPIPCLSLKLLDAPELGYFVKDGHGQILVRGPNIFTGYFRNAAKTREALDAEGWLHTGDIARLNENGTFSVIDRVKHIFKLAQGEYVAPEQVENIYIQCPVVAQFFLHGDSLQSSCVGIAVPDHEVFPNWAKAKVGVTGIIEELCKNKLVTKAVLEELREFGKRRGLNSFTQARAIKLEPEMFSVENGLLTPTMKARRAQLKTRFLPDTQALYTSLARCKF